MREPAKFSSRSWIVCESSSRWRQACWRFVPEWLAESESLQVLSLRPGDVAAQVSRMPRGVILWEMDQSNPNLTVPRFASLAAGRDLWLQIVAATGLSSRDQGALSEMGVAAFIRHPEDLPRLRRMVTGHFARSG